MRRWMLGLLALLAVGWLELWPFSPRDTGELYIIETLLVEAEAAEVRLSTGDLAVRGNTMDDAVERLEAAAPGQLFLAQTRRVIFCGGAETFCDPLSLPEQMPVGVCLYRCRAGMDALDAAHLSRVLEAREKREQPPTLARAENAAIQGRNMKLAEIEEAAYGGA